MFFFFFFDFLKPKVYCKLGQTSKKKIEGGMKESLFHIPSRQEPHIHGRPPAGFFKVIQMSESKLWCTGKVDRHN